MDNQVTIHVGKGELTIPESKTSILQARSKTIVPIQADDLDIEFKDTLIQVQPISENVS